MSKNYWLLKSEPNTWSWDDQAKSKIDMFMFIRAPPAVPPAPRVFQPARSPERHGFSATGLAPWV